MTTTTAAVDPAKMEAFQRLQSMGLEERLQLAEARATEAEQAGNIPLAQLLRAEVAKQRTPQSSVERVVVRPGAIPLLPSSQRHTGRSDQVPQSFGHQVDTLKHLSQLHGSLLDLQAKHGELMRQHLQLHQAHAEMRQVLTVLHNQANASHGMLQQLHSELYSSKG